MRNTKVSLSHTRTHTEADAQVSRSSGVSSNRWLMNLFVLGETLTCLHNTHGQLFSKSAYLFRRKIINKNNKQLLMWLLFIDWLLVIVTRLHTCFCLVCIFSFSSSLTCTHPLPLPLPSAGSWLSHLSSHFYLSPLQSCTRCPESRGSFWMFYFTCGLPVWKEVWKLLIWLRF